MCYWIIGNGGHIQRGELLSKLLAWGPDHHEEGEGNETDIMFNSSREKFLTSKQVGVYIHTNPFNKKQGETPWTSHSRVLSSWTL